MTHKKEKSRYEDNQGGPMKRNCKREKNIHKKMIKTIVARIRRMIRLMDMRIRKMTGRARSVSNKDDMRYQCHVHKQNNKNDKNKNHDNNKNRKRCEHLTKIEKNKI